MRNVEPLYGFTFPDPIVYGVKTGADGKQISVVEDKELEFDEILSAPLPKAPLEVRSKERKKERKKEKIGGGKAYWTKELHVYVSALRE